MDWQFHQGSTSQLEVELNPGWVPDRVQIPGRAERVPWHRSLLPSGGVRLCVSVEATALEQKELRLSVTARSTAPGPSGPLELPRIPTAKHADRG